MPMQYVDENCVSSTFLSSRPSAEPLTILALQELLVNLNESVENVRQEILSTVDAHQAQFVLTADQLKQLQQQVSSLQSRLNSLHQRLSCDTTESLQAQIEGLKNCLFDEEKQTRKFKSVLAFLQSICTVQIKLNEVDNHLQADEYDIAADALMSAKTILNNILSVNGKDEPDVLAILKREYNQRRGYLECKLKEILQMFLTFNPNTITVQQQLCKGSDDVGGGANEKFVSEGELSKVELSDVFDALKLLGIVKIQMSSFLKQLVKFLLTSLLHTSLNLTDTSQCIEPKITTNNEQQSASWTWTLKNEESVAAAEVTPDKNGIASVATRNCFDRKDAEKKIEDELKVTIYKNLCGALESLATFICEHVFSGQPELLRTFGKMWWRYVTENLANLLPPPSLKAVKLLTDLEVKMQSIQLIFPEEMRLHTFASEYYQKLTQQKKWKLLSTVREWILSDDIIIVNVSDGAEVGSLTALLAAAGISNSRDTNSAAVAKKGDLRIPIRQLPCLGGGDNATAEARVLLLEAVVKETDSYLRLSDCGITQNVKKIADLLHDLLRRAAEYQQERCHDSISAATSQRITRASAETVQSDKKATDEEMNVNEVYIIIRQAITLYIVLCPTVHKQRLLSDPQFTAAFFSNCSYLCHLLTTIPFIYNKYLLKTAVPQSHSSSTTTAVFMDLILLLRRMQEAFYTNMMRIQQQGIAKLVDSIEDVQRLSMDYKYTHTESVLGDVQQHLKTICGKWKPILPCEVLVESIAILIDVFLQHFIKVVLSSRNLTVADVSSLSHLLSSIELQLLIIMQTCSSNDNCGRGTLTTKSGRANGTGEDLFSWRETVNEGGRVGGGLGGVMERMKKKLVSNWDTFCLIKTLLYADLPMFLSRREKLLKSFSLDEIRNLLDMNKNLDISTTEAMTMLVSRN